MLGVLKQECNALSLKFPVCSNLLPVCFSVRLLVAFVNISIVPWWLTCTVRMPDLVHTASANTFLRFVLSYVGATWYSTSPGTITEMNWKVTSVCFCMIDNSTDSFWIALMHLTVTSWNSRQVKTNTGYKYSSTSGSQRTLYFISKHHWRTGGVLHRHAYSTFGHAAGCVYPQRPHSYLVLPHCNSIMSRMWTSTSVPALIWNTVFVCSVSLVHF